MINISNKIHALQIEVCNKLKQLYLLVINEINLGVNILDLDNKIGCLMSNLGVRSAQKLEYDTPRFACISLNNVACHGMAYSYCLQEGDVLKIDICIEKDGFFADMCRTFLIGDVNSFPDKKNLLLKNQQLLEDLENAFNNDQNKEKNLKFIANYIHTFAKKENLGLIYEYCGHGIGKKLHLPPTVSNIVYKDMEIDIPINTCICIEPMLTLSKKPGLTHVTVEGDWNVVTKDNSIVAHFENTYFFDGDKLFNLTNINNI